MGAMKRFNETCASREIIAAARRRNIGIMGIRAVPAGALTDALHRTLRETHPEMVDYRRAAPFRGLTREIGSPRPLWRIVIYSRFPAWRPAILGVKNRSELRECVAAAERGPLDRELIARLDAVVAGTD